jgi:hypothetical protein
MWSVSSLAALVYLFTSKTFDRANQWPPQTLRKIRFYQMPARLRIRAASTTPRNPGYDYDNRNDIAHPSPPAFCDVYCMLRPGRECNVPGPAQSVAIAHFGYNRCLGTKPAIPPIAAATWRRGCCQGLVGPCITFRLRGRHAHCVVSRTWKLQPSSTVNLQLDYAVLCI